MWLLILETGVLISVLGVVIWLTRILSKLNDLESIRKNVKGLSDMVNKFPSVESTLQSICHILRDKFGDDVILFQRHSPISLTEKGKELAKEINSQDLAAKYAGSLLEEVKGMNAYQIQEHCFTFSRQKLPKILETDDKPHLTK